MIPILVIVLNLCTKSFVVIDDQGKNEAAPIFAIGYLSVQVVIVHRFLGDFIGSHSERDEYVMSKV